MYRPFPSPTSTQSQTEGKRRSTQVPYTVFKFGNYLIYNPLWNVVCPMNRIACYNIFQKKLGYFSPNIVGRNKVVKIRFRLKKKKVLMAIEIERGLAIRGGTFLGGASLSLVSTKSQFFGDRRKTELMGHVYISFLLLMPFFNRPSGIL